MITHRLLYLLAALACGGASWIIGAARDERRYGPGMFGVVTGLWMLTLAFVYLWSR